MKGVTRQISVEIIKKYTIRCLVCGVWCEVEKKRLKAALSHYRTLGWSVADRGDAHKCPACVKLRRGVGSDRTLHNLGVELAVQAQSDIVSNAKGFPTSTAQVQGFPTSPPQAQGFPASPPQAQGFPTIPSTDL